MNIDFPALNRVQVLVIGDVMLDRYWHGKVKRISPEAPVPIVNIQDNDDRLGGAANVALNIANLGAQVELQGLIGHDDNGQALKERLQAQQILHNLTKTHLAPTVTKLRVMSGGQQLMRMDFEKMFSSGESTALLSRFTMSLPQCQAVIISDYGKGTVAQTQDFIDAANEQNIPVLVDPKGTDFSRYRNATLVTPNLSEFEAIVGPCHSEKDIVTKGEALRDELNLTALLITRSEKGMTLLEKGKEALHLPTQAREVYDVTGAGDTVISTIGLAVASQHALPDAVQLANLAAGIVVGKRGTATTNLAELYEAVQQNTATQSSILTEQEAVLAIRQAQAKGEKVVMTNGCFDILHAGHVAYLNEAKRLGKRLLVAVNSDDSVRRLKGPNRPINHALERMQVLAGLSAVDWVVEFSEDTPQRLIEQLLPDVLVKGGDYTPDTIAGAEAVQSNGGEVMVLQFVEGISTTAIVNQIRQQED
ncbi:MAG TPA: bifunctional D-glycero-beta-D-manno-heptose-7-phosphate kinase/D-glycero-beta-D-manno-heptose 1-phosphate adenylyltransferase HldE [Alcanivoracaceae bacterium]|nr:bifunctional D-glycero-beta-D-manno-heptose-7-phosphate kinase/D-glycero-beta-D-manno-heptose 1-phosphate adenylyltransferase HldE [Alcanivoracaceae bacterium]